MEKQEKKIKELPKVSVIVLSWDGKQYLKNLFDSLLGQSYPRDKTEIILVDNGSVDGTCDFVRQNFSQVKIFRLEKNFGFAVGNNRGAEFAKNDFLVFLNNDTICHRDWLLGLILGIFGKKEIGACASNMILPEVEDFQKRQEGSTPGALYYYDLSVFGYGKYCKETKKEIVFPKILSACSFIIRRETIIKLGYLFDKDFGTYAEDTDLSLRIHNLGLKICVVKDSVVYHLHKRELKTSFKFFSLASKAIINRTCAFFKNMGNLEFILYFPLLFLGGVFKITKSRLKTYQKIIFFFPFVFLSLFLMIISLLYLPKYTAKRKKILEERKTRHLPILDLLLFGD